MPRLLIAPAHALRIIAVAGALTASGAESARAAGSWTWPVRGEVITAFHNGSDPYAGGQHRGIDVAAAAGTPVIAAAAGTVRFAGVAGASGLTVSVRTSDGRYDTSYLHLSGVGVRKGDGVEAGGPIGAVGTSGRRSAAAAHLHFGVREAGSRHAYRDPLDFLTPPAAPPVRDVPRAAPVPVVAPVRTAPAPEPVRRPLRAPRPLPLRPRVRVPVGRRVRVPGARRAPRGVAPRPVPGPVRHGLPAPHGLPARAPAPVKAPRHSPGAGPAPVLGPRPLSAPSPSAAEPPSAAAESGGGPDLGWGLACAGLLLAAACLGRPEDRHRSAERVRPALRALLRPLTGGR